VLLVLSFDRVCPKREARGFPRVFPFPISGAIKPPSWEACAHHGVFAVGPRKGVRARAEPARPSKSAKSLCTRVGTSRIPFGFPSLLLSCCHAVRASLETNDLTAPFDPNAKSPEGHARRTRVEATCLGFTQGCLVIYPHSQPSGKSACHKGEGEHPQTQYCGWDASRCGKQHVFSSAPALVARVCDQVWSVKPPRGCGNTLELREPCCAWFAEIRGCCASAIGQTPTARVAKRNRLPVNLPLRTCCCRASVADFTHEGANASPQACPGPLKGRQLRHRKDRPLLRGGTQSRWHGHASLLSWLLAFTQWFFVCDPSSIAGTQSALLRKVWRCHGMSSVSHSPYACGVSVRWCCDSGGSTRTPPENQCVHGQSCRSAGLASALRRGRIPPSLGRFLAALRAEGTPHSGVTLSTVGYCRALPFGMITRPLGSLLRLALSSFLDCRGFVLANLGGFASCPVQLGVVSACGEADRAPNGRQCHGRNCGNCRASRTTAKSGA
jgi:hypothetical protein